MSFAPLTAKDRRGLYAESQSRSYCCVVSREATFTPFCLNMQSHILLNMQSHSREATVTKSQSRSDCYPILLNMQSHSREATVRRADAAKPLVINMKGDYFFFL